MAVPSPNLRQEHCARARALLERSVRAAPRPWVTPERPHTSEVIAAAVDALLVLRSGRDGCAGDHNMGLIDELLRDARAHSTRPVMIVVDAAVRLQQWRVSEQL